MQSINASIISSNATTSIIEDSTYLDSADISWLICIIVNIIDRIDAIISKISCNPILDTVKLIILEGKVLLRFINAVVQFISLFSRKFLNNSR